MNNSTAYRWTGVFGIVLYLLVLLEIPFHFVYTPTPAGTPPVMISLIRILIDLFICIGLIGFFSGLKTIISDLDHRLEWVATFILSSGIAFAIVSFVADSIQAGSVWSAGDNPVNPTWVGHGGEGALLIYGPINRMLIATIAIATAAIILKTRFLPAWLAWTGFVIAVYNLAFIPSLFFMTVPLNFYSTNGWNIPIAAGLFFFWMFLVSVYLIRKKLNAVGVAA